jgi:hypothetical protein
MATVLRNKFLNSFIRNENGNVMILVGIFLVVLLGMTVFAVDVGSLYHNRRQVVNAADSAALAGVQEIVRAHQNGITSNEGVRAAVTAVVEDYLDYYESALIEVTDIDGNPINANSKTVKVIAEKEAKLFFAPAFLALLGSNPSGSSDVAATATAKLEFVTDPKNIAPFAIHESLWETLDEDDQTFELFMQFNPGGRQPEPGDEDYNPWGSGNWGTVNFEGPGSNMDKIGDWIENGYEGEKAVVGETIWSAPSAGLNSCRTEIESRIGDTLIVPVISGEPNGSGPLTILGFASIRLISMSPQQGAGMVLIAELLIRDFNISDASSSDPIYDFGLESASLIQ